MRCRIGLWILISGIFLQPDLARAEATDVTVRVLARNAQFVGDLIDGAFITITDAASGEVLAQGITTGNAGNPKRIMRTPRKRGEPLAAKNDAKFVATLDIDAPRYVQVTAYGPLAERFSANRASATQWVVPGKHITGGDGWVLELPGLLVAPNLAASTVSLSEAIQGVQIGAEVMLMCGCPIRPGFFWDPKDYEVVALVYRGDSEFSKVALGYAGAASEFAATFDLQLPGVYDIKVYAYDAKSGNTGVGQIELTVTSD